MRPLGLFGAALVMALSGCSVGTITDYHRGSGVRVTLVEWSSPRELRFAFSDNVALFWLSRSPTFIASVIKSVKDCLFPVRPGYDKDGSQTGRCVCYVSRADGKPLKGGRYEFELDLDSHFSDYPHYKRHDRLTGAFTLELHHGLFLRRPKLWEPVPLGNTNWHSRDT